MSVLATLGSVRFETLQLSGFDSDRGWKWVSHETLEQLPKLEPSGAEPRTPQLKIKLHPALGSPSALSTQLEAAGDSFTVMPLTMGSGILVGWFVLERVATVRQRLADDGTLIEAELTLSLRESRPPLQPEPGPLLGVDTSVGPERTTPILVDTTGDPADMPLSQVARI